MIEEGSQVPKFQLEDANGKLVKSSDFKGKKHGLGTFTWKDGSYFTGDWRENKITGNGRYIMKDGRFYEGSWNENKMNGYGECKYKDGQTY